MQYCSDKAIIATSTMRLLVDKVFENCDCKDVSHHDRCLGVRFLYPVYYVPEVEIMPIRSCTSVDTLDRGTFRNIYSFNIYNPSLMLVRQFLEKMGQIAFFRSGNEPIVLNEQQRNSRREACIKQLTEGKSINNRFSHNIPNLGRIQFQQQQQNNQSGTNISGVNGDGDNLAIDSNDSNCDKQSLIIRNNECVICMDNQRDCVLHPCHHLCVCIKCGRLLLKRSDSCPICRRPINNAF
ncbi:Ring finger 157-like protein, partial [Euroglyphus maynei]